MTALASIVCGVDFSEHARRVMYHAAALASAFESHFTLVYASSNPGQSPADTERVRTAFLEAMPYEAGCIPDVEVVCRPGDPADVILQVASEHHASLVIAGTRARGGLARALLGSTSLALLQRTDRPVLIVPPTDLEVVTLGVDHASVHFGGILAAIDLAESNAAQVAFASELAELVRQPLFLMTVVADNVDNHSIARALRERGRGLPGARAHAVIVRHGTVPQEIARGAKAEQCGLVVLGLRQAGDRRGKPGTIAAEVLQTGRALVVAVPAVQ